MRQKKLWKETDISRSGLSLVSEHPHQFEGFGGPGQALYVRFTLKVHTLPFYWQIFGHPANAALFDADEYIKWQCDSSEPGKG